jgi:hypothetical protein
MCGVGVKGKSSARGLNVHLRLVLRSLHRNDVALRVHLRLVSGARESYRCLQHPGRFLGTRQKSFWRLPLYRVPPLLSTDEILNKRLDKIRWIR